MFSKIGDRCSRLDAFNSCERTEKPDRMRYAKELNGVAVSVVARPTRFVKEIDVNAESFRDHGQP